MNLSFKTNFTQIIFVFFVSPIMKSYSRSKETFQLEQRSNGLVVQMLDSRSRGLEFKTARWLQDQLNLLPFQGRLSEYQKVLGTKSKLYPHSGSVVLRQLHPIHKKGSYSCSFLIVHKYNKTRCNPTPKTYSNYEGIVTL